MRYRIKCIFVYFLLFISLYSQETESSASKIDSLFSIVRKTTTINNYKSNANHITIDENDLEQSKKLFYEIYAYSFDEYYDSLVQWTDRWSLELKTKSTNELKPSHRIKILKDALAQKYGKDYVNILEASYVLLVKVIETSHSSYKLNKRDIKVPQTDVLTQVVEVVKGKEFYKNGDTVTISYLPSWFHGEPSPTFITNSTYLIPVGKWIAKDHLKPKLDDSQNLYKIENDTVVCPLVPEKSPLKTWDEFKKDFQKKYLLGSIDKNNTAQDKLTAATTPSFYSATGIGAIEGFSFSVGKYFSESFSAAVKFSLFATEGSGLATHSGVGVECNYHYKTVFIFNYLSADLIKLFEASHHGYATEFTAGYNTNAKKGLGFIYEIGIGYSDVKAQYSSPQYRHQRLLGPILKIGLNYIF